jgi:hypothetical protein
MYSPSKFAAEKAKLDLRLQEANRNGELAAAQAALKELTYLIRAQYGGPAPREPTS